MEEKNALIISVRLSIWWSSSSCFLASGHNRRNSSLFTYYPARSVGFMPGTDAARLQEERLHQIIHHIRNRRQHLLLRNLWKRIFGLVTLLYICVNLFEIVRAWNPILYTVERCTVSQISPVPVRFIRHSVWTAVIRSSFHSSILWIQLSCISILNVFPAVIITY